MTTDLVPVERVPMTVFGTDEPSGIVARVTAIAGPLADFIKHQRMSTQINGREYVLAEGWAFMGAMLGVAPVTRHVSEVRDQDGKLVGFEAQVELVAKDGSIVGGAIAECSWAERNWSDRDPFALKSMAQTRATGKAYRMAFGFVMKAAGYEATPAEEMVVEERRGPVQTRTEEDSGQTFQHVGALLTWAHEQGVGRAAALNALGVKNPSDIKDLDAAAATIRKIAAELPF